MGQVKIFHDRTGKKLTVWFGNPGDEYVRSNTGENIILMLDARQQVVGFEVINFRRDYDQELFTGEVEVFEMDLDLLMGRAGSE